MTQNPTLRLQSPLRIAKRSARFWKQLVSGKFNLGHCALCEGPTVFVVNGSDLREDYVCFHCLSLPRWRALKTALEAEFPSWRELRIFESSPAGACSKLLQKECKAYVPAHFFPDVPRGGFRNGVLCQDLEALTFPDASFDLVITQEVMEHLLEPDLAFKEIARVLRTGGAHVFTIPFFRGKTTTVRAERRAGTVVDLMPKIFHGNPIDQSGSLVVREWGDDLPAYIESASGLKTEIFRIENRRLGLLGDSLEVFVSRKA